MLSIVHMEVNSSSFAREAWLTSPFPLKNGSPNSRKSDSFLPCSSTIESGSIFKSIDKITYPKALDVICIPHILDLVGDKLEVPTLTDNMSSQLLCLSLF